MRTLILTGNTVVEHPETGVRVTLTAGQEVPDWARSQDPDGPGLIGAHLYRVVGDEPDAPAESKAIGDMKLAELKQYAADNEIDLDDAATKDEVVAAILAAEASA